MNYLIIALRIIHILAGIFWVGGTLIMAFFIVPTVGAMEEAGQKFISHLMQNLKFSMTMSAAAGLTVLAGVIFFCIVFKGFTSPWMSSGAGLGFGIVAGSAIMGFITGTLVGQSLN